MAVGFSNTNKPLNPRGNDASPKGYNRAKLYSGKALSFDGVNDEVNCGDFMTDNADFSVSFYVKINTWTNNKSIVSTWDNSYNGFAIALHGSGLRSWANDGANGGMVIASLTDLGTTEYHHIVLTYDYSTGTQKGYFNGHYTNQEVFVDTMTHSDFQIGYGNAAYTYSDVNVAGVKAFSTALTAAQVSDLYNNPEKIVPTGVADSALKLWLPMQEGAGTTAYDGSGNGNHGTISGATYVNGVGAPVAQTAVIDWNKSHNYIDKSEEFETASWTENRLVTITDDSFIAPDGSATATEIVENTANDTHFLAQTLSVTAGDYFISVYVKKRDYDFIQISTGGDTSRYANFNISTGATGNANGITDLIIEDAGNGWYRIGGKITTSATSFNYFVTLIQSDVASRFQTYTGTDKGQYIWGAQATKSSTLQPYLRNIGTSAITSDVLLPQGLTSGRDITGVNLFENVRKQGALNLDGNSWAEVHDNASLDITGHITLEAWVYWDSTQTAKGILGKWNSSSTQCYLIYVASSSRAQFYTSTTGSNAQSVEYTIPSDGWVHIVGTDDGTNQKLYVNGVEEATRASLGSIFANDRVLEIGRYNEAAIRQYPNDIAQPRIYNRALTAAEVLQNYNSGKSIYTNS